MVRIMREKEEFLDALDQYFGEHGGVMRTNELYEIGLTYRNIDRLVRKQILVRIKSGYYALASQNRSESQQMHALFSDSVLTMETAMYYYGYLDEKPFCWNIAVDKNTSKSRFKIDYPIVEPYYTEPEVLKLGCTTIDIEGQEFLIYDKERLVCDCLKYENKLDHEIYKKAIMGYLKEPEKNIEALTHYAKERKVSGKLQATIGVWL